LVASLAFDLALWLRASDVKWRKRRRAKTPRTAGYARAAAAGALFGVTFALVEPPFEMFLGATATAWNGQSVWLAALFSAAGCTVVGMLSARDRAS
jgi:hypothetical protein